MLPSRNFKKGQPKKQPLYVSKKDKRKEWAKKKKKGSCFITLIREERQQRF